MIIKLDVFPRPNQKNVNDRFYEASVLDKAINDFNDNIKINGSYVDIYNPKSSFAEINVGCIIGHHTIIERDSEGNYFSNVSMLKNASKLLPKFDSLTEVEIAEKYVLAHIAFGCVDSDSVVDLHKICHYGLALREEVLNIHERRIFKIRDII